jgi:hypothetical protein
MRSIRNIGVTAALAAVLGLALAACSSSPNGSTNTPTPARSKPPAAPPAVATSTPAAAGLTGTWSGQYSGTFHGTFNVTWTQSGSNLTGAIKISNKNPDSTDDLPIQGTVNGSSITFGTLGAVVAAPITYSGSVSGDSMSGTWQMQGGQGSGSWNATKSS